MALGIRELGRRLRLDPSLVSRLVKRGMPTESEEAALRWRKEYVNVRKVGPPPVIPIDNIHDIHEDHGGDVHARRRHGEGGAQNMEATLERLRDQERLIATALESLLKAGRLSEAAALRREHCTVVRSLFDSESRALKISHAKGKLVTLDTALTMISAAMAEPLILLRRLPDLARDAEQKRALEVFLAAVLGSMKDAAAGSLKERKAG